MKTISYFLMLALCLGTLSCSDTEPFPPLPTEFEEDEEVEDPGETIINLVQDSNFETADLTRRLVDDPILYDTWTSHVLSNYTTFSFSTAYNGEQSSVGVMVNTTTSIPNSDPTRAFVAQRIKGVVESALYTFSFKGRADAGTPTCRMFIKATDTDGNVVERYFIYDSEKPTTPTGKYFAYCKNCLLSNEWQEFEYVIDFSKITTQKASITYESAEKSTAVDRTNIVICLQNNALNSTMQVDDVSLIKYVAE